MRYLSAEVVFLGAEILPCEFHLHPVELHQMLTLVLGFDFIVAFDYLHHLHVLAPARPVAAVAHCDHLFQLFPW